MWATNGRGRERSRDGQLTGNDEEPAARPGSSAAAIWVLEKASEDKAALDWGWSVRETGHRHIAETKRGTEAQAA
jgi:hypothetical protein